MASQRTMLAYISRALGLVATGYALVKIEDHPILEVLGVCGLLAGLAVFIVGVRQYRIMDRSLGKIRPRHLLSLDYSLIAEPNKEAAGR